MRKVTNSTKEFSCDIIFGTIAACIIMVGMVVMWTKDQEKKEPCITEGYTLISADSAVTNCGDTIPMKHYRPL